MTEILSNVWEFLGGRVLANLLLVISLFLTFLGIYLSFIKKPKLEFENVYVNDEPAYFLRVKIKGRGRAKDCRGWLDVKGTKIEHSPSVWAFKNRRAIDIDTHEDLRLFRIGKSAYTRYPEDSSEYLWFPCADGEEGFVENSLPIDFKDRVLYVTVKCDPKTAKPPKVFKMKIFEIIEKGKETAKAKG
jgi:hypothetical protein